MTLARAKAIFLDALARPLGERIAFITEACEGDNTLRAEVEDLLNIHDEAGQFMNRPATSDTTIGTRHTTSKEVGQRDAVLQGSMIDRYKLLEQIGEGGFGTVWMAEQREPVTRRVALKIIKLGMDTKQVIARFEAERQALAIMDHPNIARVFDAGATETGRPYFVMELVKGIPITQYCDSHNLSPHDRLDLFVSVCQAVQHAHTKGVIHRDIKPSNVLVSQHDENPVVKVIDFGIAKATAARLTEKTVFTEFRQMIGTPAYMSPEQAGQSDLDIDTRTDVYSLGVLLYELLTGTTPFDIKTLLSAGYAEVQRIIREVEPPTPSTRLSTMKDQLPSVAANRKTEPARLTRLVRGDLDWIVMKCLEKDRGRRYETANGLAADIQRYLGGEPVVAAPPSAGYKLRKFISRNKASVTAGAIVLVVLIAGAIGTTLGMVWALKERKLANQAAISERAAQIQAQERAAALERVAKFQAEQLSGIDVPLMGIRLRDSLLQKVRIQADRLRLSAQELENHLKEADKLVAGVDFTGMASESLNANIFQRALTAIGTQFDDQPLVKARLLQTVADALVAVGLLEQANAPQDQAIRIRRSLLGEVHPDTLASNHALGVLLGQMGKYEDAKPLLLDTIEKRRRILGNDDADTLTSIFALGTVLYFQGQYSQAEPYFQEALDGRRSKLGASHPDTLQSLRTHGLLRLAQGRLREAEALGREGVAGCRSTFGNNHADTLMSMSCLSSTLKWQNKYSEAEELDRAVLDGRRRLLGDEHPDTLVAMSSLGETLRNLKKLSEAELVLHEVMDRQRRVLGGDHPDTLVSISRMGMVLYDLGRYQEAEPYYREALAGRRRRLGNDHANTITSISNMGFLLQQMGQFSEAEANYREALEAGQRTRGPDHPATLTTLFNIGRLQNSQNKLTEAEATFRDVLEKRRRALGNNHPDTQNTLLSLGMVLNRAGKFAESESVLRECYQLRLSALPTGDSQIYEALSNLGDAVAKQGRYADAEPMLLESYAKLSTQSRDGQREAGKRIIDLYDAWQKAEPGIGYDSKVTAWRTKVNGSTSSPVSSQPAVRG